MTYMVYERQNYYDEDTKENRNVVPSRGYIERTGYPGYNRNRFKINFIYVDFFFFYNNDK